MAQNVHQSSEPRTVAAAEFFERVAPGEKVLVPQMAMQVRGAYNTYWELQLPVLELHCTFESCGGVRFFESKNELNAEPRELSSHFASFVCKNCTKSSKTYAFTVLIRSDGASVELTKFGEQPAFGPPTPARLVTLIGSERDYYFKGRRSENQGLGIAAFAYYRRVIENQKNRIIDEIIRVSQKIGAQSEVVEDLLAAKSETQFSKAVSTIKHGVPQAILINGHNPLLLLHSALSEGLHAQTDAECLELATSIRVVLTELAERLAAALKEEAELQAAVSRLLAKNTAPSEAGGNGG